MSSLLRSNLVVASGTALSRISGLARITVFGYVIGQTALADAYRIGNETPNIVYELLLGGVLSATLVPLFTSFDVNDDEESTNVVVTVSLVLLVGITVVAVIGAPLIFGLYTLDPSGTVDAEQFREVGTLLTRIFLIQIFFYGATGVANALLNSRRRFFAAAWSPILPNLIIIASLLSLPDAGSREWTLSDVLDDDRVRWTLGLGATAGIAAMAIVLIPAVRRAGVRFRPKLDFRHPCGAPPPDVVGMDARVRRRQPGRDRGRAQPGRSRVGRRQRLLRRLHLLRPPPRAPGDVDRDDVRARDGPSRRAQGPRRVHRPDVARRAPDRPAHRAGRDRSCSSCAGRSSGRSCSTASTRPRPPTTRRGRSPASPSA